SNLLPPIQPASSTSSLLLVPAPTLALIAEAEEPNEDEAAQPVAIITDPGIFSESTPPEDSALTSNAGAGFTDFITTTRPTTDSVALTRPTENLTKFVIATGPGSQQ
ncbi:hypothetical protein C0989_005819, partial [Termitomyces sp. Mn162]